MRHTALTLAALWALTQAGCASSPGAGERGTSARNVIFADEIATSTALDVYDLVQRHRPGWLQGRGPASIRDPRPELPVVYVDGVRFGDVESLRRFQITDVEELRYRSASEATTRYGTGHTGGVIEVRTRRR